MGGAAELQLAGTVQAVGKICRSPYPVMFRAGSWLGLRWGCWGRTHGSSRLPWPFSLTIFHLAPGTRETPDPRSQSSPLLRRHSPLRRPHSLLSSLGHLCLWAAHLGGRSCSWVPPRTRGQRGGRHACQRGTPGTQAQHQVDGGGGTSRTRGWAAVRDGPEAPLGGPEPRH